MIDVHCHLNFKAFSRDYNKVINRAFEKGVTKIINVGTKIDSSQKAVELAQKYENLYAIVGVHPHHADKVTEGHMKRAGDSSSANWRTQNDKKTDWVEELENIAQTSKKVVAIGEIGMDNYRYQSNGIVDKALQKEVFLKQIQLAYRLKLPLQIHNRHAGEDILKILKDNNDLLFDPPGMFHCMSGTIDFLKNVLDLGFFVGFDGNITYKGKAPGENTELKDLVKYAPLDRILAETDAPYLTPEPKRGSRNEPSYVILVGQFIAEMKGVPFEKVVEQTTRNAETIFKMSG